ncbi:MAG: 30S ribosomal protein S17 [Acidobacteriota bacterium]
MEQQEAREPRSPGRGHRHQKIGVVVSDRMDKTVVVEVARLVKDPLYQKYLRRRSRFMAHDERNESRVGDRVLILETRPLSRHKRWRVSSILRRGAAG